MTTKQYVLDMIQRLYAVLAYTSAVAIMGFGTMAIILAVYFRFPAWLIILGCMLTPLMAAVAWSCGNYCENPTRAHDHQCGLCADRVYQPAHVALCARHLPSLRFLPCSCSAEHPPAAPLELPPGASLPPAGEFPGRRMCLIRAKRSDNRSGEPAR